MLLLTKHVTIIRLMVFTGVANMLLLSTMFVNHRLHWITSMMLTERHQLDLILKNTKDAATSPPRPPDQILLCLFTSFNANKHKTAVNSLLMVDHAFIRTRLGLLKHKFRTTTGSHQSTIRLRNLLATYLPKVSQSVDVCGSYSKPK